LPELFSLKQKIALITGAASGIGEAIAGRFAEAGADLYLIDINKEGLNRVKEQLRAYNGKIDVFEVDLSSKQKIDEFWSNVEGKEPDIS
jgi:3-oxoacyl-[acyl-carrier protein] reductase